MLRLPSGAELRGLAVVQLHDAPVYVFLLDVVPTVQEDLADREARCP